MSMTATHIYSKLIFWILSDDTAIHSFGWDYSTTFLVMHILTVSLFCQIFTWIFKGVWCIAANECGFRWNAGQHVIGEHTVNMNLLELCHVTCHSTACFSVPPRGSGIPGIFVLSGFSCLLSQAISCSALSWNFNKATSFLFLSLDSSFPSTYPQQQFRLLLKMDYTTILHWFSHVLRKSKHFTAQYTV